MTIAALLLNKYQRKSFFAIFISIPQRDIPGAKLLDENT
jgi:hypothetical protein